MSDLFSFVVGTIIGFIAALVANYFGYGFLVALVIAGAVLWVLFLITRDEPNGFIGTGAFISIIATLCFLR